MKKLAPKPKKHKKKTKGLWGFLKSNNAKLLIILLIALAIPITVLGVQKVQNLQQEAAGTQKAGKDCSQAAGSEIIATPLAPQVGQTISFKRANGSFSQDDFDYKVVLGSGVNSNSCDFSGGEIKNCPTKKSSTAHPVTVDGKTIQAVTHTITENGKSVCDYYVAVPASPTKDPNRPTSTPKIKEGTPGYKTPTPGKPTATRAAGGNCTGSLNDASCTVDNKPRMRVSYDMRGGPGPCQAIIEQGNSKWVVTTKCTNADGIYLTQLTDKNGTKSDFKPGTQYKLTITNGTSTCNKVSQATTLSCGTTNTSATPTKPTTQNTVQCNVYKSNPSSVQQGQLCVDSNKKVISCPNCP